MYTLREILEITGKEDSHIVIMYRIALPNEISAATGYNDTLYGYCEWDGSELKALDGDNYDLNDEILHFELFETEIGEEMLSVTVEGVFLFSTDGSPMSHNDEQIEEVELPENSRGRAYRRHKDYSKAKRKQEIARKIYSSRTDTNWEYYDNLHQYSKNKIHCSCPMCAEKTNAKIHRSKGQVSFKDHDSSERDLHYREVHGSRVPTTNRRFGKKHWKYSDQKAIESMSAQQKDFEMSGTMED